MRPLTFDEIVGDVPMSASLPGVLRAMIDEIGRLRDRVAALEEFDGAV